MLLLFCGCQENAQTTSPPIFYSREYYERQRCNKANDEINALRNSKNFKEALRLCNFYISSFDPNLCKSLTSKKYMICVDEYQYFYNNKDYYNAIPAIRRAIEYCNDCDNYEYAGLYGNLASCLQQTTRYEEAMVSIEKAIEYNPEYVELYFIAFNILTDMGDSNKAAEYIKRASNVNPQKAREIILSLTDPNKNY